MTRAAGSLRAGILSLGAVNGIDLVLQAVQPILLARLLDPTAFGRIRRHAAGPSDPTPAAPARPCDTARGRPAGPAACRAPRAPDAPSRSRRAGLHHAAAHLVELD